MTILDALAKAGVAFVALKENIRVDGERDIQTKVMTTLFALFAEVERDLISERTREGLARARSSGRKLGRPKGSLGVSRLDGKEDEIRHFLELGVSKTASRPGCTQRTRATSRGRCSTPERRRSGRDRRGRLPDSWLLSPPAVRPRLNRGRRQPAARRDPLIRGRHGHSFAASRTDPARPVAGAAWQPRRPPPLPWTCSRYAVVESPATPEEISQ